MNFRGFSGVRPVPYLDSKKEKKTKKIASVELSARFQDSFLERKTHLAYTSRDSLKKKNETSKLGLRKRGVEQTVNQDTCLTGGLPQTLVKSTGSPHTARCSLQQMFFYKGKTSK